LILLVVSTAQPLLPPPPTSHLHPSFLPTSKSIIRFGLSEAINMASLPRLDGRHDPVATIQQWQLRQHNVQAEAVGHSQIANLCQSLLELFREISLNLDINDKVPRAVRVDLNRSRSAFVLWCDGYGIAQGHFDDTFSKASKLRRVVTRTVCHMGEVLTERRFSFHCRVFICNIITDLEMMITDRVGTSYRHMVRQAAGPVSARAIGSRRCWPRT
jgi:hypothetical protein